MNTKSNLNLAALEAELEKRVAEPETPWGRTQNDEWDRATSFIYTTSTWEGVKAASQSLAPDMRNYAINRWFNYWSAMGVESMFCALPGVTPAKNERDRLIDFTIHGVSFDLKTSVYPAGFEHPIALARRHPLRLINWLYQHQSSESRHHHGNRLFIILYNHQGEHWKLRSELTAMQTVIRQYMTTFNIRSLPRVHYTGRVILSDLIWFIKSKP
jgi:hypothetical protein